MDRRPGISSSTVVALGLGIVSAALPWLLVFGLEDPVSGFKSPGQIAYYRLLSGGMAFSLVLGAGAVLFSISRRHDGPLRYVGIGLGGLGIIFSLIFLLLIVGLCGPAALWGYCRP